MLFKAAVYTHDIGPVLNLREAGVTATSLTISWTLVTGDIDTLEVDYSYTVKRCSEQGPTMMEAISSSLTTSHTLRNLNEDSSYTITVRAINTAGSTMATITADTLTAGKNTHTHQQHDFFFSS